MNDMRRFLQKYEADPNSGCWLWKASLFEPNKYGAFWLDGKTIGAHKASWLLHVGPTNGLFVLHKCDTPQCVNPEHLFLGTSLDNNYDRMEKGRSVYVNGVHHGMHRLTEEQVRTIRHLRGHDTQRNLAEQFGVSVMTVSDIFRRRTWKHLP